MTLLSQRPYLRCACHAREPERGCRQLRRHFGIVAQRPYLVEKLFFYLGKIWAKTSMVGHIDPPLVSPDP